MYSVPTTGGSVQAAYAPRYVYPSGVAAAGSLVTSSALNLTSDTAASASSLPLPQSLAGVSLTLNGKAVPLLSVNPYQITYQVPPDAALGSDTLQPRFADDTSSAAATAQVVAVYPSVITLPSSELAIFHGNTGTPVDSTDPATASEVLVMYASGMGPTNPTVPAGTAAPGNPPALTANAPLLTIGARPAQVQFSGLAPGEVGVYQINFVLPSGLKAGAQELVLNAPDEFSAFSGILYVK